MIREWRARRTGSQVAIAVGANGGLAGGHPYIAAPRVELQDQVLGGRAHATGGKVAAPGDVVVDDLLLGAGSPAELLVVRRVVVVLLLNVPLYHTVGVREGGERKTGSDRREGWCSHTSSSQGRRTERRHEAGGMCDVGRGGGGRLGAAMRPGGWNPPSEKRSRQSMAKEQKGTRVEWHQVNGCWWWYLYKKRVEFTSVGTGG